MFKKLLLGYQNDDTYIVSSIKFYHYMNCHGSTGIMGIYWGTSIQIRYSYWRRKAVNRGSYWNMKETPRQFFNSYIF